ncbi:MAG: hypothetical protein AB1656_09780 [Candidatus Omnitrophota bacterium]
MLGFFRRSKEEKEQAKKKAKKRKIKLDRVLLWIDGAHRDLASRTLRALALGEAFHRAGAQDTVLACPALGWLAEAAKERGLFFLDSVQEGVPMRFQEIIAASPADILVADPVVPIPAPMAAAGKIRPLFVQIGDAFSESLFSSDLLILPGVIPLPDFEHLHLPPSRLTNCIHGEKYVPLPDIYSMRKKISAEGRKTFLAAIAGNPALDEAAALVEALQTVGGGGMTLLADVSPAMLESLREKFAGMRISGREASIKDRLALIEEAEWIAAYPAIQIYEFLALGKPVLLCPRTSAEASACQQIAGVGAGFSAWEDGRLSLERVKSLAAELNADEAKRRSAGAKAAESIPFGGADRLVSLIADRWGERLEYYGAA